MNDFIAKPFSTEELVAKCRAWAKRRDNQSAEEAKPAQPASSRLSSDALEKYSLDFLKSLFEVFLETAPPAFQELLDALDNKDWEGVRRSAHYLRGGTSRLLNPKLQAELEHVEKLCSNSSAPPEPIDVLTLKSLFQSACMEAESLMNQCCQSTPSIAGGGAR
jgi:HPt (histidine-containing phosphotransfer) domain-containing protein